MNWVLLAIDVFLVIAAIRMWAISRKIIKGSAMGAREATETRLKLARVIALLGGSPGDDAEIEARSFVLRHIDLVENHEINQMAHRQLVCLVRETIERWGGRDLIGADSICKELVVALKKSGS